MRKDIKKLLKTKKKYSKILKLGAILGLAFLDVGGKNINFGLNIKGGKKKNKEIIGMCLFWQFWSWYPIISLISLCFKPTFIIGINENLDVPKILYISDKNVSKIKSLNSFNERISKKTEYLKESKLSITKIKIRKYKDIIMIKNNYGFHKVKNKFIEIQRVRIYENKEFLLKKCNYNINLKINFNILKNPFSSNFLKYKVITL